MCLTVPIPNSKSIWKREHLPHIAWAAVIALLCVAGILWKNDLVKDAPNTLATVGTFVTVYGVIFAIIELSRAKMASELAREQSKRVLHAVTSLVTAREIIECQAVVVTALSALDEGRVPSTVSLSQILKLYSQVFHSEVLVSTSKHCANRSIIESYSFNPNVVKGKTSSTHTRRALLSVAGHLGELQGSTKNFTEYVK